MMHSMLINHLPKFTSQCGIVRLLDLQPRPVLIKCCRGSLPLKEGHVFILPIRKELVNVSMFKEMVNLLGRTFYSETASEPSIASSSPEGVGNPQPLAQWMYGLR
jgi:hypothetical protein